MSGISRRQKARAIELWHTPMTAAEIADQCGFASSNSVRNFWVDCKRADPPLLPEGHRPFFPPLPTAAELAARDLADGDDDIADDPFEHGMPFGDGLLMALQSVHGADPLRAHDDAVEVCVAEGRKTYTTPSCARLQQGRTRRDLFVKALIGLDRGYGAMASIDLAGGVPSQRMYLAVLGTWRRRQANRMVRCASC